MKKFDVSKYEEPEQKNINMDKTRHNVNVFLKAYQTSRVRIGESAEPAINKDFTVVSFPEYLIKKQADKSAIKEFIELHDFFIKGFSAIQHHRKLSISDRRKNIFILRYIKGFAVLPIAQQISFSEELVMKEAAKSIVQFAGALDIIEYKK